LDLRDDIDPAAYPYYFKPLVRCLFGSRRKTVKNNLQNFMSSAAKTAAVKTALTPRGQPPGGQTKGGETGGFEPQAAALDALALAGINPNERAERLCLEEFTALAEAAGKVLAGNGQAGGGLAGDSL
jgi:16S rRNA (adenine1518-N6/adenine1519-N6)-dimethyltransferase